MSLQLFVDMLSQPCRSVYIFAKKNNLPVEIKEISLPKGEHLSAEYGRVNPRGKVPALKDGDFCMGESVPMMEYMAQKFNTADHWFPKDLQKRARVNEFLAWQHVGLRVPGTKLYWMTVVAPVFELEVPEDRRASVLEDLNSALDLIDETFIREGGFIGGDQISVADLQAIVEIMQPFAVGVDVFGGRRRLSEWRDRVVQAVGKELFDEAHQKVLASEEAVKHFDPSKKEFFIPRVLKKIS